MDSGDDWYSVQTATFGDRVAAAREAAGMSEPELARRLGVRVATVRSWEGDHSEPRANRLSMMAGLLNVSMMWLINGNGNGLVAPREATEPQALETRKVLRELRELRRDLISRAEQVGRLEHRLNATLMACVDD